MISAHHEPLITQGEARSRSRERVHAPEARPKGKAAAKAKLPAKPPPKAPQPKAPQPKAKAPQPKAELMKVLGKVCRRFAEMQNLFAYIWNNCVSASFLILDMHFETVWFNANL